ncbi:MAG: hypothetical protein IJI83_02095 [Oscillospiraceae bacterium]|nr:hypothetical protein [Oscillospiraceae bacterium]
MTFATVSVAVVNNSTGKTVYMNSRNHGAFIPSDESFFREQDPEKLYEIAVALLEDALGRFFPIGSIGFTGQMHDILYVDGSGKALSPLYTWQDNRILSTASSGKTYAEEIREKTGYSISPGYGLGTHYVL